MKFRLSSIAIAIVLLACLVIDFDLKLWKKQDRVIEWDVHSYYAYLPALFVYDDIKLEKSIYQFDDDYWLFWPNTTADGKKVIKTSMGVAILYAPFFFVAHAFASSPLSDHLPDGFSAPYKFFLLLGAVFYLFVALEFIRKILRHFRFRDVHIAATVLLIGLGTNLLCYSSQSASMPHVYSFCLFAIFIYCSVKWHEHRTVKNTLLLGFLLGLISLIRVTNFLIILFFILYDITTIHELKQKFLFFIKNLRLILFLLLPFILVWVPQFIYWKTTSGNYFYYSYTDERFFFMHPKIMEGLFSFRKGWLLYTPMIAFAVAGIFLMKDELRKLQLNITIFFLLNIYIIFSWWAWWYGGTFGQRPMVESYALLAIPFASFIKFISERKLFFQISFYCLAGFFIWLNIFQTYQFEVHTLHWDGMTNRLYFKQFGKMDPIPDFDKYVERPDYEKAKGIIQKSDEAESELVKNAFTSKEEVSRKRINLKAANGKFICADESQNHMIFANRDKASSWETFTLIMFDDSECAILASDKHFFSADLKHRNEVTATRSAVGYWETFIIIQLDSSTVAFKAVNGKYLSLNNESLWIMANGDTIGSQEKFMLINY